MLFSKGNEFMLYQTLCNPFDLHHIHAHLKVSNYLYPDTKLGLFREEIACAGAVQYIPAVRGGFNPA